MSKGVYDWFSEESSCFSSAKVPLLEASLHVLFLCVQTLTVAYGITVLLLTHDCDASHDEKAWPRAPRDGVSGEAAAEPAANAA
jgi:hypothetical protein